MKVQVVEEMVPEVRAHIQPVMERFICALQEFLAAGEEVEASARWSRDLLGVSRVPDVLRDQALFERLRHLYDVVTSKYTF